MMIYRMYTFIISLFIYSSFHPFFPPSIIRTTVVHVQSEIAAFKKRFKNPTRDASLLHLWSGNRCDLVRIDKQLHLNKFDNFNSYEEIYCDMMPDFRRHRINRKPQILLVGLNCNDDDQKGKDKNSEKLTRLWQMYFNDNNGPGVHLYGIDNEYNVTKECLNKTDRYMTGLYTRDLGIKKLNKTLVVESFIKEVHKGPRLDQQKFDVIIDDGKYSIENHYLYQKRSFFSLWPHVQLGGLYFMENMKASSSKNGWLMTMLLINHSIIQPILFLSQPPYLPKHTILTLIIEFLQVCFGTYWVGWIILCPQFNMQIPPMPIGRHGISI